MKARLLLTAFLVLLTQFIFYGCASAVPPKTSDGDSLVVIKMEIINPNGFQLGRDYFLNYSGDYAPSRIGEYGTRFMLLVVNNDSVMTSSISTAVRAGFTGNRAEWEFVNPLPYQPGTVAIADFVLTWKIWRESEGGFVSSLSPRKIGDQEKVDFLNEIRSDGAFTAWFPAPK
ncbi:MAG TPA: hypothetical protein VL354_19200 [Spirochaetia bacterium]|nr:hypothetical protein [Spirochaetia bacterium]